MLHLLFVVAVVIIAIALLPAALVVLPWLLAAGLLVVGIGLLIVLFAYAPDTAVALVATAGVVAASYGLTQSLRRGGGRRETTKTPSQSPGQPSDPLGSALQQLRDALTAQLRDLERELQLSRERIQPSVERRKELAKSLRLGERLLLVVRDITYYASQSERDPAAVCGLVSNVVVTEKSIHDYTVQFEFKQRRYAVEYTEYTGYEWEDGTFRRSGHVTLRSLDGVEVFTGRFSEYGGPVKFDDIEAFLPGAWLEEFLELAERIDALGRERTLQYELGQVQRQRERFGVDADMLGLDGDAPTRGMPPGEPQPRRLSERCGRAATRWARWIRLLR